LAFAEFCEEFGVKTGEITAPDGVGLEGHSEGVLHWCIGDLGTVGTVVAVGSLKKAAG